MSENPLYYRRFAENLNRLRFDVLERFPPQHQPNFDSLGARVVIGNYPKAYPKPPIFYGLKDERHGQILNTFAVPTHPLYFKDVESGIIHLNELFFERSDVQIRYALGIIAGLDLSTQPVTTHGVDLAPEDRAAVLAELQDACIEVPLLEQVLIKRRAYERRIYFADGENRPQLIGGMSLGDQLFPDQSLGFLDTLYQTVYGMYANDLNIRGGDVRFFIDDIRSGQISEPITTMNLGIVVYDLVRNIGGSPWPVLDSLQIGNVKETEAAFHELDGTAESNRRNYLAEMVNARALDELNVQNFSSAQNFLASQPRGTNFRAN